jgi:hypothetical protein
VSLTQIFGNMPHVYGNGAALMNACESPAERLFAGGFLMGDFDVRPAGTAWAIELNGATLTLKPQHEITLDLDPWAKGGDATVVIARPDFALLRDGAVVLLIDIDGHDFHERTKTQVRADRSRDRQLLRCRLPLARFTGSEVYASASGCAKEAFALALTLAEKP